LQPNKLQQQLLPNQFLCMLLSMRRTTLELTISSAGEAVLLNFAYQSTA
jgi:hypothetical protein